MTNNGVNNTLYRKILIEKNEPHTKPRVSAGFGKNETLC